MPPPPRVRDRGGSTKRFGIVLAVDDLWLDIREGEFFSLLGPSGCGKTTTLRMLAGFEEPDARHDPPPRARRHAASAEQARHEPRLPALRALPAHDGLRERRATACGCARSASRELSRRVPTRCASSALEELAGRGARQLSGGQQQRVALARAIVNRPAVLLLDEPLSALDVKLRKQMQLELKRIQHQLGTTFVYVTHDQEEALLLSDRIGVMDRGRLHQVATPARALRAARHGFVADFVGSLNVFDGRLLAVSSGVATVRDRRQGRSHHGVAGTSPGTMAKAGRPDSDRPDPRRHPARACRLARLDAASRAPGRAIDPTWSRLEGEVDEVVYLGSITQVIVAVGPDRIVCQRTSDGTLDASCPGAR